jgi:hypothetical protein
VTGRHRFRVWPWVVSVVLVATMLVLLAVNGVLTTPSSGTDAVGRPVGAMDRVPVQVPEGGSVLDATHSPVRSLVYPARTVALTFDDGPDPQWTPQILAVLRKHQVPGTFFVLGGKVVRHPGLVRDMRFPRFSGVFEDWFDLANQGGRLCCQHHGSTPTSCGNERFGCIGSPSRDQRSASWASC